MPEAFLEEVPQELRAEGVGAGTGGRERGEQRPRAKALWQERTWQAWASQWTWLGAELRQKSWDPEGSTWLCSCTLGLPAQQPSPTALCGAQAPGSGPHRELALQLPTHAV